MDVQPMISRLHNIFHTYGIYEWNEKQRIKVTFEQKKAPGKPTELTPKNNQENNWGRPVPRRLKQTKTYI